MGQVNQRVELIAHTPFPEQVVALGAKLCYSKSNISNLLERIGKSDGNSFIEKIMSMGHLSTCEHASFTFGIEGVSRAFLAQITRHRIASFSVQSQRYVGVNEDFNYIIPPEILALSPGDVKVFEEQMLQMGKYYKYWQQRLGGKGEKVNEDARFVLPNACETKMIVTMNTRELLHFFTLRLCSRAQWEIRSVAWQMLEKVMEVAPALFALSGPSCVYGKCAEGEKTCGKMKEMKEKFASLLPSQEA